jgi:hypothetical protein
MKPDGGVDVAKDHAAFGQIVGQPSIDAVLVVLRQDAGRVRVACNLLVLCGQGR